MSEIVNVKDAIKTAIQMEQDGYAFYKKASRNQNNGSGNIGSTSASCRFHESSNDVHKRTMLYHVPTIPNNAPPTDKNPSKPFCHARRSGLTTDM